MIGDPVLHLHINVVLSGFQHYSELVVKLNYFVAVVDIFGLRMLLYL